MLSRGDFKSALELFGKISRETENLPQYSDILTDLLKAGFLNDCIPGMKETLLVNLNETIVTGAVYRAAIELAKETPFENIVTHIHSMNDLVLLHPRHDHLFFECITLLGDRGFLNIHDPGILIRLAESIGDRGIKERAISSIVIKIAKIGVQSEKPRLPPAGSRPYRRDNRAGDPLCYPEQRHRRSIAARRPAG